MDKNKRFYTVIVSAVTTVFAVVLVGVSLSYSSAESLLNSGFTSSGRLGVGSSTPGTSLSVLGDAGINILTVDNVFKASHVIATSTLVVRDGSNGIRLKDSDGSNCHKITVNSSGTVSAEAVNCETGAITVIADSFDSYSSGTLGGKSGGTNWSANWAKQTTDDFAIQTSGCQAGNCVKADAANTVGEARTFSTLNSGSISIYLKRAAEDNEGAVVFFCGGGSTTCDDATETFGILFRRSSFGDVHLRASGGSDNLGSWTANTWQLVEVRFGGNGGLCSSTQVQARLNGGTWSTCRGMDAQNTVGSVYLTGGGTNDEFWVDELTITP